MPLNIDAELKALAEELGIKDVKKAYRNSDINEVSIIDTKAVGGKMRISGYASTITADLTDEVVLPSSFESHLWRYQKNPIICFQHDRNQVVGKALNVEIVKDKGLWMDMDLAPVPFVKDYLWVLLEGEYLKQMSIGFLSMKGHQDKKYYIHDETYLLENSIVTIACNPDAEIGVQKALSQIKSLEDFEKHKDVFDSIINKRHYQLGGINELLASQSEKTIMAQTITPGIFATKLADTYKLADDTSVVNEPILNEATKEKLYLAKKIDDEGATSYLWNIASATVGGDIVITAEKLKTSVAYALGAKGSILSPLERKEIVNQIVEIYKKLDWKVPTYNTGGDTAEPCSVEFLNEKDIETLQYHKLNFHEGEDTAITLKVMQDAFRTINATSVRKEYRDSPVIREEVAKFLMATFEVWGFITTPEDVAKITEIMQVLVPEDDEEEDDLSEVPSAFDTVDNVAPEGEGKEVLTEEATAEPVFRIIVSNE